MRVDLEYEAKWIFCINHPVWFLTGIILSMWHSLLTTMIHYFPYKPLYICTLHTKVKCARFPVLKIRWFLIVFLNSNISTPILSPVDMCAILKEPQPIPKTSMHIWHIGVTDSPAITVGLMIRYQPITAL